MTEGSTADRSPVPVSIDGAGVEASWAAQWSGDLVERVGRRQEPALDRSMSLPIHVRGPKGVSLTERPFELVCRVVRMDRDGRLKGRNAVNRQLSPTVNGSMREGHGRVTQCPIGTGEQQREGDMAVMPADARALGDVLGEMQTKLDAIKREFAEIKCGREERERQRAMYRESVRLSLCAHGVCVSERCGACENEWAPELPVGGTDAEMRVASVAYLLKGGARPNDIVRLLEGSY